MSAAAAGRADRELELVRPEWEDRSRPCRNNPCSHGTADASGRSDRNAELRRRAARIAELCLDYIPNAEFDRKHAAAEFLASMPHCGGAPRRARAPSDSASYLAGLYEVSLLTAEQERHLFRQYNYLKYRASALRRRLDAARPRVRLLDEIEALHRRAVEAKNLLVRSNLRLVVSIAKKFATERNDLFEVISDGNLSLMKAVEKFDYGRGFKFSTYATWAIKRNFARDYSVRIRQSDRFQSGQEERLNLAPDSRSSGYEQLRRAERHEVQVEEMLGRLDDREREIIRRRFGLAGRPQGLTLEQAGDGFGISKERIRQIEVKALAKLRESAELGRIEI